MASKQFALEYQYNSEGLNISFAGYYKEEDDLRDRFLLSQGIAEGIRTIRGLEFSLRKYICEKIILDIANTFLDVRVDAGDFSYRASNDLNYFFKLGLTVFNNDVFNAGLSYVGRPGRYYTDIITGIPNGGDALMPVFEDGINDSQYGSYNNLSVTFNRQISLPNGKGLILFALVNNVLNTENESYAVYNTDYTQKNFEYYGKRWIYFEGMVYL